MRYALIVLMVAVLALSACEAEDPEPEFVPAPDTPQPEVPIPPEDIFDDDIDDIDDDWDPAMDAEPDVLIRMDGGRFWFEVDGVRNPEIVVQQGDLVRIDFTSVEGNHDVVIDELGVASEVVSDDESTYVEFIADQVGEFEYYCSVGSHREQGMYGTFIVE